MHVLAIFNSVHDDAWALVAAAAARAPLSARVIQRAA
jgi:hypothetical protein